MSTIGITSPAFPGAAFTHPARSTRLRLTLRGRRVLATLAAIPAVVAISLAMVSGGSALASRDAGTPAESFSTVTVSFGDTLWSIASRVAPGRDPRAVVFDLQHANGLADATVHAGQVLRVG